MSSAAPLPGRLWPGLAAALLLGLTAQGQAQSSASQSSSSSAQSSSSAHSSAAASAAAPANPLSPAARAKASYAIGLQFGTQMKSAGFSGKTISMPDLEKGLRAALGGKELKREDLEPAQAYMMALREAAADVNRQKAKTFLAANAKKPGVITTASGLQYKVLQAGSGNPPKPTDTVSVNYTGKLLDGTEFDGTDRHGGQPASFPVGGLIKGFSEALQLMKPGAKFQVYIPPELGYDMHVPPQIPPGSALVFDIELLKVLPPPPPKPVVPPQHPVVPPAH